MGSSLWLAPTALASSFRTLRVLHGLSHAFCLRKSHAFALFALWAHYMHSLRSCSPCTTFHVVPYLGSGISFARQNHAFALLVPAAYWVMYALRGYTPCGGAVCCACLRLRWGSRLVRASLSTIRFTFHMSSTDCHVKHTPLCYLVTLPRRVGWFVRPSYTPTHIETMELSVEVGVGSKPGA